MKSVSLDKVFFFKKKFEHGLEGNIPSGLRIFFFKFWISLFWRNWLVGECPIL